MHNKTHSFILPSHSLLTSGRFVYDPVRSATLQNVRSMRFPRRVSKLLNHGRRRDYAQLRIEAGVWFLVTCGLETIGCVIKREIAF